MRKQYFVANNLLDEWRSMQMTVMSEGFLLNSKYIKMGREEGGFQALLTQLPHVPGFIDAPEHWAPFNFPYRIYTLLLLLLLLLTSYIYIKSISSHK